MSSGSTPLSGFLRRFRDGLRKLVVAPGTVCYFPRFATADDLANHYYRAAWYLPQQSERCRSVTFPVRSPIATTDAPNACPPDMAPPNAPPRHFELCSGLFATLLSLWRADLILVWRGGRWTHLALRLRSLGLRIVVVDTEEPAAREYVQYANLLWHELTPAEEQARVEEDHHSRFREIAGNLRREIGNEAFVFGTGPSLNRSLGLHFDGALKIACNTIVASPELLDHIAPHFIAAADVVSHFGVSRYAASFRQALIERLEKPNGPIFVTTTALGTLLLAHHPSLEAQVLMIGYHGTDPCFDLIEDFRAPAMESVFNSFMLPLAATFCRHIRLIGCDGRIPSGENEDFWAHTSDAHFADLVDSGHRCHPTFDLARRDGGYDRYDRDVAESTRQGEKLGISYHCVFPSFLPSLQRYSAPGDDRSDS